jgi:oligoendopeptidase F
VPNDAPALAALPGGLSLDAWDDLAPLYGELQARELADGGLEGWLADWSRLAERVGEAASLTSIRYTQDTEDPDRKAAYLHYVKAIAPEVRVAEQALKERFLATEEEPEGLEMALRQFRADADLFRAENVPLQAEEQALAARYGEIVGGLTVDFDGEARTLAQLAPYRARPERELREGAWRAGMEGLLGVRGELDALFDQLLALRVRIAANAGYDNYRDYRWRQMGRFDYSPQDAVRLQAAVLSVAVPALARAAARRAAALGLETLRPWDTEVDVYGGQPLAPFRTGEELAEGSRRIFERLDPRLGEQVALMAGEGLLDLDNRKGKAPGGYCSTLPERGRPFIFMNAVGTEDNVRTMLHEAGHAFHAFEKQRLGYIWQRRTPMEFNEVASMSMELLTSPYLGRSSGGFYTERDAARARLQHLERILVFMPYMATVDAFQHWLYAHPDHSRAERDAAWLDLHRRYNVGADWSGLEDSRESSWQHKLHIFEAPFYYIEYGLAQLGALQVWRNSLADAEGALDAYRRALSLGGTVPLPELFQAAGARLVFDEASVTALIGLVEAAIDAEAERLQSLAA